jgi:hypothetical protein
MNELPRVLWEQARPVQRTSVTPAFSKAGVGAALGLAQFGLRLAVRGVAGRALEWSAALLGCFPSFFLFSLFRASYRETQASLVPI